MTRWLQNNGDKLLTFITMICTLTQTQELLVGPIAKWLTFISAVAATAHTVFVSPTSTPVIPTPDPTVYTIKAKPAAKPKKAK